MPAVKLSKSVLLVPRLVAPALPLTLGISEAKAMVPLASASSTRPAATRRSRFCRIAVSIRTGSSGELKLVHQLASGQTGAFLSTTGAVKTEGASADRRAVGGGVNWQAASSRATALTDSVRDIVRIK